MSPLLLLPMPPHGRLLVCKPWQAWRLVPELTRAPTPLTDARQAGKLIERCIRYGMADGRRGPSRAARRALADWRPSH